jgi:hypothetical protein
MWNWKMNKIPKISNVIFIFVLCLILNGTGLSCIRIVRLGEEDPLASSSKTSQVSDKDRLISAFGYPDEFTVIFDEGQDNLRVEMWLYSDLERYFTFENGEYTGGDTVITPKLTSDNFRAKPNDFIYGMSQQSVSDLIGERGIAVIDETSGLTSVIFNQSHISCTFNERNQLVTALRTREVSGSR